MSCWCLLAENQIAGVAGADLELIEKDLKSVRAADRAGLDGADAKSVFLRLLRAGPAIRKRCA